jgi:uncharacterized protein YpiB (UPF0302 family)
MNSEVVTTERFGVITVEGKRRAIRKFCQMPLKHPMSRFLLQSMLENESLLEKIVFVNNRALLPNTMLVSEMGSSHAGFELELGARQYEEVSIINGRLVRHVKRTRRLQVNEPVQALEALSDFSGRLYVMFSFAGKIPDWYLEVVEPNPAEPCDSDEDSSDLELVLKEITSEQMDLAIWCILLRHEVERALASKDKEAFLKAARLLNKLEERCLWEFE